MAKKKNNGNGGNALAVVEPSKYPALCPDSDIAEAMAANMEGETIQESDLRRVPTPAGGATRWVVPTVMGEQVEDELVGILVGYERRGVLWPTEEVSNSMPLLITRDLITAQRVGDDYGDIDPDELEKHRTDGGYDWLSLPWNEWGSGKNGIGKRCKESRLLFLLREGEPFPLLVRAQPGSLKTVRPFITQLPIPHWRAVVSLTLQVAESRGGPKYAQIVPRLVGTLSKEDGEAVCKLYTQPIKKMTAGVMESDKEPTEE